MVAVPQCMLVPHLTIGEEAASLWEVYSDVPSQTTVVGSSLKKNKETFHDKTFHRFQPFVANMSVTYT